jgi:hypothetical protein
VEETTGASLVTGVHLGALKEARNLTATKSDTSKTTLSSQQKIEQSRMIKEGIKTIQR